MSEIPFVVSPFLYFYNFTPQTFALNLQYSKKLTTAVTIAWIVFRTLTIIAAVIRPDSTSFLVELQNGADDVMMAAMGFYCGNSVAEKGISKYFTAKYVKNDEVSNDDSSSDVANG